MDIRDNPHTQLEEHIKTIRNIAKQTPPPQLVWEEIKRYLEESALHLESFMLPKIEVKTPYLDLRSGVLGSHNKTAELVGIAGKDEVEEPKGGFLTPADKI